MSPAPEVVTLGEALIALVGDEPLPLDACTRFRRFVAGAESNVAIGLARLGHRVRWIGRLGGDAFGRTVLRQLRGEGVEVRVRTDAEAPTGLLLRDRREAGATEVAYYRRGSAGSRLAPGDLAAEDFAGPGLCHLSGVTPALSQGAREAWFHALELARAAGRPVCLDPNLRRRLWREDEARSVLRRALPAVRWLLPGEDELELLAEGGDRAERAGRLLGEFPGLELVVVKEGAAGCTAYARDRAEHAPGVPLARVVDPVGAGDAFAAGFLTGLLRGLPLAGTLALANRCGAAATTAPGDTEAALREGEAAPAGDVLR